MSEYLSHARTDAVFQAVHEFSLPVIHEFSLPVIRGVGQYPLGNRVVVTDKRLLLAYPGLIQHSRTGDGEGAPIHMPMIRLETAENYRLMPSDNFIVKNPGLRQSIKPTTFGVPPTALTTELLRP